MNCRNAITWEEKFKLDVCGSSELPAGSEDHFYDDLEDSETGGDQPVWTCYG